jgi:hypothetical protein
MPPDRSGPVSSEVPYDVPLHPDPARRLPFGEHVIPLAIAVGTLTGAAYRLLRVTPSILMGGWDGPGTPPARVRTVAEQLESEAPSYLTALAMHSTALGRPRRTLRWTVHSTCRGIVPIWRNVCSRD